MSDLRLPDRHLGPKRLKIAIACERCRTSKKKCDGVRPACNQCQRKHTPCNYRSDPGATNGTVTGLRTRHKARNRHASLPIPSQDPSPDTERSELDETPPAEPPPGVVHGTFAGEVKAALTARLGIHSNKKAVGLTPMKDAPLFDLRLDPQACGAGAVVDSVLPQRRQADHLLGLFWHHLQPLEPVLDQGSFTRSYEALFAGQPLPGNADERVFLSTLNTVFALSTQLQEHMPVGERNHAANIYFHRASALIRIETILWGEPGSIEVVQCLLLMARYLQCSNNPHQTWMTVGIAVRMAQSIGLDRPDLSPDGFPEDGASRNSKARLWQCCVYMDRMLSWVTGRTPIILPANLPHHLTKEGAPRRPHQPTDYFTKAMEVYEISNHITLSQIPRRNFLDTLGAPPRFQLEDHISNVAKFDACFDKWANDVPEALRYRNADRRTGSISHKQALVLQLRLIHGRLSLFRPLLARYCLYRHPNNTNGIMTGKDGGNLSVSIVREIAAACVENAQEMIGLVVDECSATPSSNSIGTIPWWYRVLYLHVACTVLMAATLQPNLSTPAVFESWDRAMAALRAHEHLSPFVSQCLATFKTLSSGMSAGAHDQQEQSYDSGMAGVEGASILNSDTGFPPLQDVLLQDMVVDNESIFFGMEDLSWMGQAP